MFIAYSDSAIPTPDIGVATSRNPSSEYVSGLGSKDVEFTAPIFANDRNERTVFRNVVGGSGTTGERVRK